MIMANFSGIDSKLIIIILEELFNHLTAKPHHRTKNGKAGVGGGKCT
jgi:hypothetical protein